MMASGKRAPAFIKREQSLAINDFAERFNDELAAGRHCVHMQAYDIGGDQIRYDGIWKDGGNRGQTRAIAWAFSDLCGGARLKRQAVEACPYAGYDIGGAADPV